MRTRCLNQCVFALTDPLPEPDQIRRRQSLQLPPPSYPTDLRTPYCDRVHFFLNQWLKVDNKNHPDLPHTLATLCTRDELIATRQECNQGVLGPEARGRMEDENGKTVLYKWTNTVEG